MIVERNVATYLANEFSNEIFWGVQLARAVYQADSIRYDSSADVLPEFPGTIIRSDYYLEDRSSLRFLLAQSDRTLYISVRGTVNMTNWLSNFTILSKYFSTDGGSVGQVHSGFFDMASHIDVGDIHERINIDVGDIHERIKNEVRLFVYYI